MKVVEFNTVPYGSTGRIAQSIAKVAQEAGIEAYFVCGWTKKRRKSLDDHNIIATGFCSKASHLFISKVFGLDGFGSFFATKKLIRKLKKINPDIVHFHIMHDAFLYMPSLLNYIRENNISVCWTFHDCWAFTGGCPYFDYSKCNKWMSECNECQECKVYSMIDANISNKLFKFKKKIANTLDGLVIITPSEWLSGIVGQSFYANHECRVINNGINLQIFKYTESDFRKRYSCEDKKIVLGVALGWGARKGLDVFNDLASILPEDYVIVLVGTNKEIDTQLDQRIISIHKTYSQSELAEIYSAADVFVNPTREDNFPTVNIEALSCGVPVITFNTGGSPEIITDNCGIVVDEKTAKGLLPSILKVCEEKPFSADACRERALQYEEYKAYEKYVDTYLSEFQKG